MCGLHIEDVFCPGFFARIFVPNRITSPGLSCPNGTYNIEISMSGGVMYLL